MDPYKILGVERGASKEEIRRGYRKQAGKYHPDRGGDNWIFQQIRDAYEELTGEKESLPAEPNSSTSSTTNETQETSFDGDQSFDFEMPESPPPYHGQASWHARRTRGHRKRKLKLPNRVIKGTLVGIIALLLTFVAARIWVVAGSDGRAYLLSIFESNGQTNLVATESNSSSKQPRSNENGSSDTPSDPFRRAEKNTDEFEGATGRSGNLVSSLPDELPYDPVLSFSFENDERWLIPGSIDPDQIHTTSGRVGKGLHVRDGGCAEGAANFPSGNQPRTLAVWIKSYQTRYSQNVHVINFGQPSPDQVFGIMVAANRWRFFDWGGGLDSDVEIDTDWHHHCLTFTGSKLVYYLDGETVASADKTLATKAGPLCIGLLHKEYDHGFAGIIDEIVIYRQPLSDAQVKTLYSLGQRGEHPRVAYSTITNPTQTQDPTISPGRRSISGNTNVPGNRGVPGKTSKAKNSPRKIGVGTSTNKR